MPTFRCWAVAEGKATEQPIDTSSAAGKAFLDMLGVFAEFETNLRSERQMEGIAAAKLRGVYKGRPASIAPPRSRRFSCAFSCQISATSGHCRHSPASETQWGRIDAGRASRLVQKTSARIR